MLNDLKEFFLIPVQFFRSATKLTYASLAVAIGILYLRIIFRKRDGFKDSPDYQWFKLKVGILIMICVGSYLLAFHQLPEWFPSFFQ
jgi:uncharacterized membrane protein